MRGLRLLVIGCVIGSVLAACGDDGGDPGSAAPDPVSTSSPTTSPVVDECAPARAAEAGTTTRTYSYDGDERSYELTVPQGYDGLEPAPVVLNLHGFGGTGAGQNEGTDMPERAGARGYVVVAPDSGTLRLIEGTPEADEAAARGYEGIAFWNVFSGLDEIDFGAGGTFFGDPSAVGDDDVGFLGALLDEVTAQLCIDERRVYSTGMSNGAGMTTVLGCEIGERLAAIAPVAGVNLTGACGGDAPVPVLAIHGDADDLASFEGNGLFGFELGNPSVTERMIQWAEHNGCSLDSVVDEPVPGVVRTTWPDCVDDIPTELWVVTGMGHVWPNGPDAQPPAPFEATEVVLDFFDGEELGGRADG